MGYVPIFQLEEGEVMKKLFLLALVFLMVVVVVRGHP